MKCSAHAAQGDEENDEYPEQPETLSEEEDTYHASSQEWCVGNDLGEWEPEDPEGYEEEDAASKEDDGPSDQEEAG
eukprot:12900652-Prorocentrum_lima.AAC.1